MRKQEIKEGIYYVGAVDWDVRAFHGYSTERGATYNAYLVIDEKIALIDTAKAPFAAELIERIKEIVDMDKIDFVISNHVEMDHSGSIPAIMKEAVNAKIVTSEPSGLAGLKAHYGDQYEFIGVKGNESFSLGKRTLVFVTTPMLHWPDNMVTYCPEEKLLFSNDAFGQHYATNLIFDDQVDYSELMHEAKKYFANILMPYGKQAVKALEIVKGLDIDMIAPSHGVVWRSHIKDIFAAYESWAMEEFKESAVVVYDSMWGSTEKMARTIIEAFAIKGIPAKLFDLKVNHISNVMTEVLTSKYLIVGSPTLNNNMLPTVAAFLCYMKGLAPKERRGFAFGSYGWGGHGVLGVNKELERIGIDIMCDPIKLTYVPTSKQIKEIEQHVINMLDKE